MKEKSIELLNKAVADELTAVHQYMYFHFHCDDQGFDLLANLFRRTAIEEMMHVENALILKKQIKIIIYMKRVVFGRLWVVFPPSRWIW